MALIDKLTAIANAIREKTGGTDLLTLDQMAEEISGISSGGVSLDKAVVLVANFSDSSTLVITEGAYYGTKQAIAAI